VRILKKDNDGYADLLKCDTDDVTITALPSISVSTLPTISGDVTSNSQNIATETTLSTLNGKITTCNTGAVTVSTQPVRDRLTDNVGVAIQTDVILNDTTALTPKFKSISASSSGDNTLVSAVASKKIRVLSLVLIADDEVDVRFESGASGTALSGQMALTTNTGFVLPFNPVGWFETASNTLLNLELSDAVGVNGCLTYVEV